MATNPAVSLPRASAMREALSNLELFVVSDNVLSNDTVNAGAHLLLPAAAWGEKDGTVTNSERRISRQRAFLPLPGEAKPDWWIVAEVARRMGFGAAFAFHSAADIFREHAALSAFENDGTRDFDLGGCGGDHGRGLRRHDAGPMAVARGRTGRAAMSAFSRTVDFSRRTARPSLSRRKPPPLREPVTGNFRSASTPAAFATNGTR